MHSTNKEKNELQGELKQSLLMSDLNINEIEVPMKPNGGQIDFQVYHNSNVYATKNCLDQECQHIPFKIYDSNGIILDHQTHKLIEKSKVTQNKIERSSISYCQYYQLGQLKKCQKCGLQFQALDYERSILQKLHLSLDLDNPKRCPGCQLQQCHICKQSIGLYGQFQLRSCINCQIQYFNCKNIAIRGSLNFFKRFFSVCFYLILLILYTAFMLCFLPFYVMYRIIRKSIKINKYPKINIILQIFIFPFYLLYLVFYILIYYTACLIPKSFKYYMSTVGRYMGLNDEEDEAWLVLED